MHTFLQCKHLDFKTIIAIINCSNSLVSFTSLQNVVQLEQFLAENNPRKSLQQRAANIGLYARKTAAKFRPGKKYTCGQKFSYVQTNCSITSETDI